jgi:hypothetical protein
VDGLEKLDQIGLHAAQRPADCLCVVAPAVHVDTQRGHRRHHRRPGRDNGWLLLALLTLGALFLATFIRWLFARERTGREPLLSTSLFRVRTSNLGLTHIPQPVISPATPELLADPHLTHGWWTALHRALDHLAGCLRSGRRSGRSGCAAFPLILGIDAPDRIERVTGHGDLPWANLTHVLLTVMDWERWGSVPVGFDAGLLHAYSLRVPAVAARVRHEFAGILATPAGQLGELAALCELLQSVAQGEYADIAEPLMKRAEALTGRRPPVPPPR